MCRLPKTKVRDVNTFKRRLTAAEDTGRVGTCLSCPHPRVGDAGVYSLQKQTRRLPLSQGPADWEKGTRWRQDDWMKGPTLFSEAPGPFFHPDLSSPATEGTSRPATGGFFSGNTDKPEQKDLQLLKFGSSQQKKHLNLDTLWRAPADPMPGPNTEEDPLSHPRAAQGHQSGENH